MDKIVLEGVEFHAYHGVYPEEARFGTRFIVDVELCLTLPSDDELAHSISYEAVYHILQYEVTKTQHKLIESLAHAIAKRLLTDYDRIQALKVRVHKPFAPLPGVFKDVYVEVNHSRPS